MSVAPYKTILSAEAEPNPRQLRQLLRAHRRNLSAGRQRHASRQLVRFAQRQSWYIRARRLALYIAADGEIDPQLLMQHAMAKGKRVYLPQLLKGNRLGFGEYRRGMRLWRNRFGIPEPLKRDVQAISRLDVVLLPLVAFDRGGNRLGMGGGFYDRTFSNSACARNALSVEPSAIASSALQKWKTPRLIGVAHHFQEVERLSSQPWDVPLDGILTDRGWIAAAR